MEIKALFERSADGWLVAVPELDNFVTTAKRLDKATEVIKLLASKRSGNPVCDIIVKVEAVMPALFAILKPRKPKCAPL